jgi:hypothetical protein
MRTTLDIDDDVLTAAKELAKTRKSTAGKVISELVREALRGRAPSAAGDANGLLLKDGWYVLQRRGGPIATIELVQHLLDDADAEDAGIDRDR